MDMENEKTILPEDKAGDEQSSERRYRPEEEKAKNALIKAETLGEQTKSKKPRDKKISQKRLEIAIACAVVLAVIIPVFIFVIKPILNKKPPVEEIELIDDGNGESGEVLYSSDRVAMMQTIGFFEASKIVMNNENGEWYLEYSEEDKQYYIAGHTGAPYSQATFATLLSDFRTGATQKRIFKECPDFSVYGLDASSDPISYRMEMPSGACHIVYIGKAVPTGDGYYARYAYKGADGKLTERKALYVVTASMHDNAAMAMNDFISTIITMPLEQKSYIPSQFTIFHGEEAFVNILSLSEEEIAESETAKVSHVYTSDGCEYDSGTEYTAMLYEVLMPGINGNRVVAVGSDEEELSSEELAAFGINTSAPDAWLHFKAPIGLDANDKPIELEQDVLFSAKTEDGKYYAYVMLYDTIVEIDASAIEFLSWDVAEFAEDGIYLMLVTNVKHVTYDSTKVPDKYAAMGITRIKEGFTVTSVDSKTADGSPIQKVTKVVMDSTGKSVPDAIDKNNEKVDGIDNFKWLYASLMAVNVQFDLPDKDASKIDLTKDADVTITIETIKGKTHTLQFYFYDTRHAFYVYDGDGRFYLIIDELAKVFNSIPDLQAGIAIDYFTKN